MQQNNAFQIRLITLSVLTALALVACGGSDGNSSPNSASTSSSVSIPAEPSGVGSVETTDAPSGVTAYVDAGATNASNACNATLDTNAGVRVLKGMLDIWKPYTQAVDIAALAASGTCAAVAASGWDGTTGTVLNSTIHAANIKYVETATGSSRTTAQALAAYMDDRRNKGYSVSDGMGPLTSIWRAGTGQTTSIVAVDPTTAVTAVSDTGNNLGSTTSALGTAVTFIDSGNISSGSTTPAKYFYKYPRPWRWSSSVVVVPALESAKGSNAATDGGFNSGHTAEAWRDVLPMAYLFPQRFQELITRAMELGENRIIAGMHSPLDVMGGRIQATAVVAYGLNKDTAEYRKTAYDLVQSYLMTKTSSSDFNALNTAAHTIATTDSSNANYDRFADRATNKSLYNARMTYGFSKISANDGKTATVPKGAEVLLETRLPYLTADQRRVVLKTTEIDSGYPLANDDEGWGRLNLYAAADGYGAFNGDVAVTMDASSGGFNALDNWRNDISGKGKLSKLGSGTLRLTGANSYSGGTIIAAGTLAADSTTAFGSGDVFMKGGTLESAAPGALTIGGAYTQTAGTLNLVMSGAGKGVLNVSGNAVIAGGALNISFSGYTPSVGDTITVLTAAKLSGSFTSVTVSGYKVTTTYDGSSLKLRLDAKSS